MSAVSETQLRRLYEHTPDPWNFRDSPYELAKFTASIGFLGGQRFASALELGCGNGELGRLLASISEAYTGVDAVDKALSEARKAIPKGEFHRLFLPGELPAGNYDLIVLSEILYFLDVPGIEALARQLGERWPRATILCVNYLGPTGNALQGDEAAAHFRRRITPGFECELWLRHPRYLLEKFVPGSHAPGDRASAPPAKAAASRGAGQGAGAC